MQKELLTALHTQRSKLVLKIENNRFMIGKEEFAPFSAEMHYFRVNKRYWSYCFERIRKAGFRIVCTAIPWNLHESPPGNFDFTGNSDSRKDLVVFLELAREFGLKVIIKPGPYIDSQWHNGGYPEYVFEMQEILARDAQGNFIPLWTNGSSSPNARKPSLGHPRFKSQVKKYFNNLAEVIKNYAFPKGPIFALQLDHQSEGDLGPFAADYNLDSVRGPYSLFLQKKYQDLKLLKSVYKEKWKSFEEALPPKELLVKNPADLAKYFDWLEFKEEWAEMYLKSLKETLQENEISIIFFTNSAVQREILPGVSRALLESDQILSTGAARWNDDYWLLESQLKYWGGGSFPWITEFYCGNCSSNPAEHRKYFPVTPAATKFLYTLALSSGVKAFNFHMFVERDHWYDAALGLDGSIQPNYEMMAKLMQLNERVPVNKLESVSRVGLALYRPYLWYHRLLTKYPFDYFEELQRISSGVSRDLGYLTIDYQVLDLEASAFDNCDLVFVPSAEFMSQTVQEKIVGLIKSGKKVVLFGQVPVWGSDFKKCVVLSKFLKIKSVSDRQVAGVEDRQRSFPAHVLGYLKKTGKGSKEIMWHQNKCVAARTASGKGIGYFFSFDFTSHKNPVKLLFLEELFKENKIYPAGATSELEVNLKIQKFDSSYLLYLFNPSGSFWNQKPENKKDVIVKLDTKRLGLKGSLKLTELVNSETIKTSANELASGLNFSLGEFDSRIYLVGK